MAKISSEKLEPGMKLAKAVENASGMVLLGENTELNMELIDKIKNMGIECVYVQGMSKPSESLEVMLRGINERFKAVENEPHMDTIKKVLQEHIASLYE